MFSQRSFEDPFDDSSLVGATFLDILWQDNAGNSALMMAAAENRTFHVKGILAMALSSAKLNQVLDMRNNAGMTALDIARKLNHTVAEQLIEAYAATRNRRLIDHIFCLTSTDRLSLDLIGSPYSH